MGLRFKCAVPLMAFLLTVPFSVLATDEYTPSGSKSS
jgi:hypothetical protein